MSEILFSMLLTCTVIVAFNLFALESNAMFSVQTVIAVCNVGCLLPSNFTYCLLAEQVTDNLLHVGDILYDSPWYRLPLQQQKLLIIPIQRAQREFRLKSLRLINCSLAVFSAVSILSSQDKHFEATQKCYYRSNTSIEVQRSACKHF